MGLGPLDVNLSTYWSCIGLYTSDDSKHYYNKLMNCLVDFKIAVVRIAS